MHKSFTAQVDAITHDSDPKLLNFERLSLDPSEQAGEGVVFSRLGTLLNLTQLGTGAAPAIPGPIVSALTGGTHTDVITLDQLTTGQVDMDVTYNVGLGSLKLGQLTTGQISLVFHYTDLTSSTYTIYGAQLAALATAQGKGGATSSLDGSFDLTSIFARPSSPKVIDSIDWSVDTAFGAYLTAGTIGIEIITGTDYNWVIPGGTNIAITHSGVVGAPQNQPWNNTTSGVLCIISVTGTVPDIDTLTLSGAALAALAVAQGFTGATSGAIDVTSLIVGPNPSKAIDSATLNLSIGFGPGLTAGNMSLRSSSSATPIIAKSNIQTPGTVAAGPGLLISYGLGDTMYLDVTIAGAITGPNTLVVTLAPPVVIADLTAGSTFVTFVMDDLTTYTFPISFADMLTLATNSGLNEWTANSALLAWDLTPLIGKTIVNVIFNDTPGYTAYLASPNSIGSDSELKIVYNEDLSTPAVFPGSELIAPSLNFTVGATAIPYDGTFYFNIVLKLRSSPETTVQVTTQLAATTILAAATVPQLASQNARVACVGTIWDPYDGYLPITGQLNFLGPYAVVGAVPPSAVQIVINDPMSGQYTFGGPQGIGTAPNGVTSGPLDGQILTISEGFAIDVNVDLYPRDIPEIFGSQVVTEPYELRQRNLPAFKFRVIGLTGETSPNFGVQAFVSQGTTTESNLDREWCPIPVDTLTAAGATKEVQTPSIDTAQGMTGLPNGFCGAMILIPKEYTGPWNYIRFAFYPGGDTSPEDYVGIELQITANAREII